MLDENAMLACLRGALPDLQLVYLFGSQSRGDAQGGSDVDLAFRAGTGIDAISRFRLQEQLAAALHRDVDLVDLTAASTVMRVQIIAHGRLLYEREAGAAARFEMVVLASYARLNEERRGILDDVHRLGSVHG